jgi:hypothetical protein
MVFPRPASRGTELIPRPKPQFGDPWGPLHHRRSPFLNSGFDSSWQSPAADQETPRKVSLKRRRANSHIGTAQFQYLRGSLHTLNRHLGWPFFLARNSASRARDVITEHVRYWPTADTPSCTEHVRFRG